MGTCGSQTLGSCGQACARTHAQAHTEHIHTHKQGREGMVSKQKQPDDAEDPAAAALAQRSRDCKTRAACGVTGHLPSSLSAVPLTHGQRGALCPLTHGQRGALYPLTHGQRGARCPLTHGQRGAQCPDLQRAVHPRTRLYPSQIITEPPTHDGGSSQIIIVPPTCERRPSPPYPGRCLSLKEQVPPLPNSKHCRLLAHTYLDTQVCALSLFTPPPTHEHWRACSRRPWTERNSLVEEGLHLAEGHQGGLVAQGRALVAHHVCRRQAHTGSGGCKQLALQGGTQARKARVG